MACCVIGGSGFIGCHVVDRLLAGGREVLVVGRRKEAPPRLDRRARYQCHDYGDKAFVAQALSGVDEVIDLAYSTVPKSSFDDPVYDITTNLPQAVNLLQGLADKGGIRKVVVVSSGGTVYGAALQVPVTEDHQTNPISPYGITKLAVERYAFMYHRLFDLPATVVRPSNAFGEGQLPDRGQGFIANAIAAILRNEPVTVFGGDQIVRDYVHVADVADGIVAVLERGRAGRCYNIGSGTGRTTNEVLALISGLAQRAGIRTTVEQRPLRGFDVPINVLDCRRIQTETGWAMKIGFEEGLERTWRWFVDGRANLSHSPNR